MQNEQKTELIDSRESYSDETKRRLKDLENFMAKWHSLPAQRSQQWFDDRLYSVGASEMATLLEKLVGKKLNPYQTIRTMIGGKCGLVPFGDKRAVNWGCILEKIVTMLTEIIFDCHIEEMGSIPTAGMRYQRSSPDGVAVVPCLGNKIVSFEFKAPKNRIPRGIVPAYYRPQVLTCLCAVEPSDLGIFVDVAIRRCSIEQWRFDSQDYDYEYHKEVDLGDPVALTSLYFYDVEKTAEAKSQPGNESVDVSGIVEIMTAMEELKLEEVTNLGTCSPKVFDDFFARACAHTMRVEYGRIIVLKDEQPNWEDELAAHPKCTGYLPLKIMRCSVCPVRKDPKYVFQFQPLIDEIIETIKIIMNSPEADRRAVYERECDARGWTEVPYGH